MTFSNAGSVLATLTQVNFMGALTSRVKSLPVTELVCLLDFVTAEFQQFIRAMDLINNEALETLLEQLLDAFTVKIGQILQADRTTIFLVDANKNQLWHKTVDGLTGEDIEIRLPMDAGILGYVATTGKSLNVLHGREHEHFNAEVDEPPNYRVETILCMPIFSSKSQHEPVAVVRLLNKAGNAPFTEEDEQQFQAFADSIGIILESCQSFYVVARNQRGVAALLRATTTLGQSLDLETTLRSVMDQARDLMQADRSTLFLLNPETNELWTKLAKADGKTMMEVRIPANKGIAGYVASTGQTLNITDAYDDPRFDPSTDQQTGYRTRTVLCMPVHNAKGELIGVTQLINKTQGTFTTSDEEFLRAFNSQAGMALQNSQLFQNVMVEKQYQKDMLQSLSDAVISTDLQGRIVTINEAALELLGCPVNQDKSKHNLVIWEDKLIDRYVWEVVPIDNLQFRLEDSLLNAARHYVPEQSLTVGLLVETTLGSAAADTEAESYILAVPDRNDPTLYYAWGENSAWTEEVAQAELANSQSLFSLRNADLYHPYCPLPISGSRIKVIERSLNLTVNPLINPEGGARGGLVVLEDISREKRMKTTMSRYMTPGVVDKIMALGEGSLMVGERKEVTILFSDIRGYTTLTENLGASEVVALLNQYFETMVEAVFHYEGTLDKFIGDALMAVFGAPLPLNPPESHGWMAVQSALDMRRRLKEFNDSRPGADPFRFGIGISSGEVVSGNIGSEKRMDYTVIGDAVNLSSRLEQLTKEYGCDIILSEFTYNLCRERIWVRELDKVRVKGKNQPVGIYELLQINSDPLDGETERFLELYNNGRHAYIARNFQQAINYFEAALAMRPSDRPVEVQIERSLSYLEIPPPDEWDGVHTMTKK
ncbi:MAG: GAF domain-containing protein [Microcoleus sp. PH2017_29_MFU_D_A]|jgi:adenylate cyclase|uniref:GAF domain-containing protein n=1 Tax=unclassified Microcoleus TaxID=2642155 RepID=UPI001D7A2BD1|nr:MULTISPECIES: GAF domain-containing protein [unclassified Microcoleus]MCC3418164.1 GAF domain-containing protein [Microcoleus sp. PH2017_07_MST_O_A]MCC3429007.1 GAF domain-containing protein [Microcoleus sp. PH2017_04_SCI_O_A]MCC3440552.1 GAF domain-containing protein [Microcoleus sp. PH2017_03_ELD_O_A]MCC3465370.1 GAF domain-containing protein [Microcoleus sp. PH2017_06_SFM_O_A]MCC3502955.1 GAF domain-containing protein [Microcoleus sp. PH2017_19_SFW_U_A]MCC3508150.1 GAF domain-containing